MHDQGNFPKGIVDGREWVKAINKIETESHTSGLTDRITQLLKAEKEKREEIKNEPKTKKVD